MTKESQDKINQLQVLEQNMQTISVQKRTFQSQLMETESALAELDKSDITYKIIGNIMVKAEKNELKKSLESKKEILNIRIKSLDKQEEKLKEKALSLQKEVMESMK